MTAEHDSLAYHTERVAARRLARIHGLSAADALAAVLAQAAARAGVADTAALLAARASERGAAQRRKDERTTQREAQRLARRHPLEPALPGGWCAWFDGSATPNPGAIGVGALLCGPDGQRVEISRRMGLGGSSDAEYLALIALLEAAQAAGATPLTVFGDSQVVIGDVAAAGPGAKGLEGYRLRVRALMAQVGGVTLRWVPRHRNGEADRLSQQAIGQR